MTRLLSACRVIRRRLFILVLIVLSVGFSVSSSRNALASTQDLISIDTTKAAPAAESDDADFIISNSSPRQGEPIKVSVSIAENSEAPPAITFNGSENRLYPEEVNGRTVYSAVIAIPAQLKPGTYAIKYGAGTSGGAERSITVRDGAFATQRLTLPKKKDNFIASPGEKEAIGKAKLTLTETKRWDGTIHRPIAKCRLASRFGLKRIVNGRLLKDYFHSGLDFAAPQGTPIHPCAPGKVILAHTGWRLHGNCVVVDHGWGVISIYIHMQKVHAKAGDEVTEEDVLGTVGQTGRASGPHLHFSVYVNNVASNPEGWFRGTF